MKDQRCEAVPRSAHVGLDSHSLHQPKTGVKTGVRVHFARQPTGDMTADEDRALNRLQKVHSDPFFHTGQWAEVTQRELRGLRVGDRVELRQQQLYAIN